MGNADDEKFKEDIKNSGCNMLEDPYEFKRGNDSLWVNEFVYTQPFLSSVAYVLLKGEDFLASGYYTLEKFGVGIRTIYPQPFPFDITHVVFKEKTPKDQLKPNAPKI